MTNEQAILNYLSRVKSATKQEILRACSVYESGEYIARLREKGHRIALVWVKGYSKASGRKIRFGLYVYRGMK